MEEFSRVNLYRFMSERCNYREIFYSMSESSVQIIKDIYSQLHSIQDGIEKYFLVNRREDVGKEGLEEDLERMVKERDSKLRIFIRDGNHVKFDSNGKRKEVDISEILKTPEYYPKGKINEYLFSSVISASESLSDGRLDSIDKREFDHKNLVNQIFLSHAYLDRTYTFALFCYLYSRGIYIYVDWMHSSLLPNGVLIKSNLSNNLSLSKKLLFLASVNSELSIRGGSSVRQWCSWEIGNFYTQCRPKYVLRIYQPLEGIKSKSSLKNPIFNSFSPIKSSKDLL